MNYEYPQISDMIGVTMKEVRTNADHSKTSNELYFVSEDGTTWMFFHRQDCCETVEIEDVCGDLKDLVGSPILLAEEVSSDDEEKPYEGCESYTWTFYKFATNKGSVTVRWLGTSNGYYSESVDFVKEVSSCK